jgi:hypothetical protein
MVGTYHRWRGFRYAVTARSMMSQPWFASCLDLLAYDKDYPVSDASCGLPGPIPCDALNCSSRFHFRRSCLLRLFLKIALEGFRIATPFCSLSGVVWVLVPVVALSGRIRLSGFNHRFPQTCFAKFLFPWQLKPFDFSLSAYWKIKRPK